MVYDHVKSSLIDVGFVRCGVLLGQRWHLLGLHDIRSLIIIALANESIIFPVDTYYMEDYCTARSRDTNRYVSITKGALIYSQRGANYQNNLDCSLILYTTNTQGWILNLKSEMIDLEENLDCIRVSDGNQLNQPTSPTTSHCTNTLFQSTTTQKYLTISMTTDSSSTRSGFRLVVTPINQGE